MRTVMDTMKGIDTHFIQRTDTCTVSGKVFFTQTIKNTPIRPDFPETTDTSITQVYIYLTSNNQNPVIVQTTIDSKGVQGIYPLFPEDIPPKIGEHFVGIISKNTGELLRSGEDMTQLYAHIPACAVQNELDGVQHISLSESGYEHFQPASTFSLAQRGKLLNILDMIHTVPHADLQKLETMLAWISPSSHPTTQYLVSTLSDFVDKSLYGEQSLGFDEKNIDRLYDIKMHTPHLSRSENVFLSEMFHHFENLSSEYRPFIAEAVPYLLNIEHLTSDQRDIAQALTMAAIKQYKDHPEAEKPLTLPTSTMVWNISPYPESVEPLVIHLQSIVSRYSIEIRAAETKQEHQFSPVLPYISFEIGGMMMLVLLCMIGMQRIWTMKALKE